MKTIKFIISIVLIGIFFLLIRETDKSSKMVDEVFYLLGTICYVGLLVILATKTNFFKSRKNESNTL